MGHSTSSGRASGGVAATSTSPAAERQASFEDEIDRATFSGNGNVRTFQIAGIGAAQVRYGRDEFGNVGWTARVATPNSDLNPINGNRRFESREAAESRAREVLKNRVRADRAEFQRERARQESIIRANDRVRGRTRSDEEVSRRANRAAEINAANRRRRG